MLLKLLVPIERFEVVNSKANNVCFFPQYLNNLLVESVIFVQMAS